MTDEKMIQYAVEEGFAAAAIVDTSEIVFDPSFRPYMVPIIPVLPIAVLRKR